MPAQNPFGSLSPPLVPPSSPAAAGGRFDPQLLAPLAVLAAAILGRKNPGIAGFASGFGQTLLQQQGRQQEMGLQQQRLGQDQAQFDASLQLRRQELEEARAQREDLRRQSLLAPIIRQFGELAPTLTTKDEYERAIASYEAQALAVGGRPTMLRALFPYMAPKADQRAAVYVQRFLKNPMNADALRDPRFRDLPAELDLNDDGVAEIHTMGELIKLAGPTLGIALDQQGRPFIAPKDANPSEFERALDIATQEFTAENGRQPDGSNPKEARLIYEKAQALAKKPETPKVVPRPRFSVQTVLTPEGKGGLVRLNVETGDVEPVQMPEGFAPATADERNKAAARKIVVTAVTELENLSRRVIRRVGPAQRADAIKRGVEAVFGNDPEFRTYQDAKRAMAGNLAVLQQGSRPSDADIEAIWVPLVPDPYRDTRESMDMKWRLIRTMSGLQSPGASDAAPPAGETVPRLDSLYEQYRSGGER